MINQNQAIESLKTEAASNATSNAILHMFALRRRARQDVTIDGLHLRMKEEGFMFDKREYEPLLKLMAKLGFGHLHTDSKGRIVALKAIPVKLQSLGLAACGKDGTIEKLRKKNRYRDVVLQYKAEEPPVKPTVKMPQISVTVDIRDTPVTFPIPSDLTDEEVAKLVTKFRMFASSL